MFCCVHIKPETRAVGGLIEELFGSSVSATFSFLVAFASRLIDARILTHRALLNFRPFLHDILLPINYRLYEYLLGTRRIQARLGMRRMRCLALQGCRASSTRKSTNKTIPNVTTTRCTVTVQVWMAFAYAPQLLILILGDNNKWLELVVGMVEMSVFLAKHASRS